MGYLANLDQLALFVRIDRKSTRLNSSHRCISYAVFCLKKKETRLWLNPWTCADFARNGARGHCPNVLFLRCDAGGGVSSFPHERNYLSAQPARNHGRLALSAALH